MAFRVLLPVPKRIFFAFPDIMNNLKDSVKFTNAAKQTQVTRIRYLSLCWQNGGRH